MFCGGEMEARVSQRPVVALVTGDQEEVSESESPAAQADQKEAISGEEGEPRRSPHTGGTGPSAQIPARLVEMMPEMFH